MLVLSLQLERFQSPTFTSSGLFRAIYIYIMTDSKANQKVSALVRIVKYLRIDKRKIVLNSFIRTQFNHFP